MFKGSQRNCTVLVAPLDHRQNCKSCNALLLRLESKMSFLVMNACISPERSHQSWSFTKSDLIALYRFAFEFYIAIIVRSQLDFSNAVCLQRLDISGHGSVRKPGDVGGGSQCDPHWARSTAWDSLQFPLLLVWMLGLLLLFFLSNS